MTANLLYNVQLKLHDGAFILSTYPFCRYCLNIFSPFTFNLCLVCILQVEEKDEEERGDRGRVLSIRCDGRTLSYELHDSASCFLLLFLFISIYEKRSPRLQWHPPCSLHRGENSLSLRLVHQPNEKRQEWRREQSWLRHDKVCRLGPRCHFPGKCKCGL